MAISGFIQPNGKVLLGPVGPAEPAGGRAVQTMGVRVGGQRKLAADRPPESEGRRPETSP